MKSWLAFVLKGLLGAVVSGLGVLCWLGSVSDWVLLATGEGIGWKGVSHFAGGMWGMLLGAVVFYVVGESLCAAFAGISHD
jgi:hypothetical protein